MQSFLSLISLIVYKIISSEINAFQKEIKEESDELIIVLICAIAFKFDTDMKR